MTEPVRLHKQEKTSYVNLLNNRVEAWVLSHATLCLFVLMALLLIGFVMVCFAICGASAVESGTMRNFMNGGYV